MSYLKELNEKRIGELSNCVEYTNQEISQLKAREFTGTITDWLDHEFESSSAKTEEFTQFTQAFKKAITEKLIGFTLLNFSQGHFYISLFAQNNTTRKIVCILISDVRHFPNAWYNDILIRTAVNETDYTGGRNHSVKFDSLQETAVKLTAL